MFVVEMLSDLAVNKIVVQDAQGDRAEFMCSGHAFQILRGVISALAVFLLAGPISIFFEIPQTQWAFEILAVVPLLRGFVHLDLSRFQRSFRFTPVAVAEAAPQLVTLIMAWPLALITDDYSAVVWLILIQNIVYLSLSHFFAERSFSLSWNSDIVKRIFQFGWPLLLNGLLMFIILQGDKVLVGKFFSMLELGWYSAAFALALVPAMLVMKVAYTLLLPLMSRVKNDQELFTRNSETVFQLGLFLSVLYTAFFSLFGGFLITLLFGDAFSSGAYLMSWLGFMQGIRIAKSGPYSSAIALGNTKIPLASNLARGLCFVLAILALSHGASILQLVLIAVAGEILAYLLGLMLLSRSVRFNLANHLLAASVLWGTVTLAIVIPIEIELESISNWLFPLTVAIWMALLVLAYKLLPHGRALIISQLSDLTFSRKP